MVDRTMAPPVVSLAPAGARSYRVPSAVAHPCEASALTAAIAGSRCLTDPAFAAEVASGGCFHDVRAAHAASRTRFGAALEAEVRSSRRLVVFGDYDVDGVCATASMFLALCMARARLAGVTWQSFVDPSAAGLALGVAAMIPERRDGYGLSPSAVARAVADGAATFVACDNGTNALPALAAAEREGLRVLVVDHHPPVSDAVAFWSVPGPRRLWNPAFGGAAADVLRDSGGELHACAALLVDLVACELFTRLGLDPDCPDRAVLAGVATVTDVMPLRSSNRAAVRGAIAGLAAAQCPPGLARLAREELVRSRVIDSADEVSECPAAALDADSIGFGLGPRLNACGRTGDAALGFAMVSCDRDMAPALALRVEAANDERRQRQSRAQAAVEPLVDLAARTPSDPWPHLDRFPRTFDLDAVVVRASPDRSVVLAHVPGVLAIACVAGSDSGVAGLVASWISGRLGCPALFCGMVAPPCDTAPTQLSGSGRTPPTSPFAAVDAGALAAAVFATLSGSAGGHSVAFGARILVPPGRQRFVEAVRHLTARFAARLVAALASLHPDRLAILRPSVVGERPVESCDLSVSATSFTPGLVLGLSSLGPFGRGFPPPLVHVTLPPSHVVPLGKAGSFVISPAPVRGAPRFLCFGGAFPGGLDVFRDSGAAAQVEAGGCSVVGRAKPSYFGYGRRSASWNGPGAEMVVEAILPAA